MELEKISGFIIRIGDKRYRAHFKGRTPGKEIVFKLLLKTKISHLVEGQVTFSDGNERFFSNGVFYFPEPDMAVFYTKSGILTDRRDFERLPTGEILGFLRDMKNIEGKIAISAYDLSEKGAKIATYYPLVEKKHGYLIELDLDPRVFPFFNLQLGSVIFNAQCGVANMQAGKNDEIFYGLSFLKTPSESERLIRMFLRDYGMVLEDEGFDGRTAVKLSPQAKGSGLPPGAKDAHGKKPASKYKVKPEAGSSSRSFAAERKNERDSVSLQEEHYYSEPSAAQYPVKEPVLPRFAPLAKRAGRVAWVAALGCGMLYAAFLLCQHHTRKKIMREIAGIPIFEELAPFENKRDALEQKPEVLVDSGPLDAKKTAAPPFVPSVVPGDIRPDNFVSVVRENKLPIYIIDNTEYVSLRSLLKLFRCEQEAGQNRQLAAIPYMDAMIVLRLESSEMVIRGEKMSMAYPVKKIAEEFLVSVDVMEEALILAR